MISEKKYAMFFVCVISASLVFLGSTQAEFYKYVDRDGITRYVDDKSKIPVDCLENITSYEEKHDHLSEDEKKLILQREHETDEHARRMTEMENEEERLRRLHKKIEEAEKRMAETVSPKTKKIRLGSGESKVRVFNNRVLTPVTISFNGKEIDTTLVLDTGASITIIHSSIADKMDLVYHRDADAVVANGMRVKMKLAKLDCLKVGPAEKKNIQIGVIGYQGNQLAQGLLGMDFLKNFDYRVDYERKVIQWHAETKRD